MKTTLTLWITLLFLTCLYGQTTVATFTDGTPDDAIAIDSNGNVYASNFTGDTVFKYDSVGNATPFVTGLNTPNGLAFDSSDKLYVCDWAANLILRYDTNGLLESSWTVTGNPSGMIKAYDNDDMIYTRYSGNTIHRITPTGVITPVSTAPELNGPVGLAYDEFGVLYVGNFNDREIYRVEANGDLTYIAQLPATGAMPNLGFITYAQGNLWGTILGEHKIYSVDPNSTDSYSLFAGSVLGSMDGSISEATFNKPNGIVFNDAEDTMYITDFGSKNLRIISNVTLSAGDKELKKNEISVFPNPLHDQVNIHWSLIDLSPLSIKVHDVMGRLIFSSDVVPDQHLFTYKIDSSLWQSGSYFITLETDNSTLSSQLVK